MRKYLSVVLFVSLFSISAWAFDDGDWQVWLTENAKAKINDQWCFSLTEEERYGDDASYFYRHHTDLALISKIDKNWKASFHFRYISEKKKGEWLEEYRPYVNLTYTFPVGELKISNKVQFEYRHQEHNEFYRFRDKLKLSLPKMGILSPYIGEEIFIDTENEKINRNRLTVGTKISLTKKTSLDIYYLWQTDEKKDHWKDTNIVGIKISFKF